MSITLISSPPSPYARKVRIALKEKNVTFETRMETPWDKTTETPSWNPLEKLPILIENTEGIVVYESHLIMDYIEHKYPQHPILIPTTFEARLQAKKVEAVADGVCDAMILKIWEQRRSREQQSLEWTARQQRKIDGGLKAIENWISQTDATYLVEDTYGLADIAVGCMAGFLNFRMPGEPSWVESYPSLQKYCEMLERRSTFRGTIPEQFPKGGVQDKVV